MNRNRIVPLATAGLALVCLATFAAAQMRPSSPEALEKMQPLARLVGEWRGEARMQTGPETREVVTQQERVEWTAGGEALLIRGLGTVEGKVVHDAVAVIAWDAHAGRYTMWTYRAGGAPMTPEISVSAAGFSWGFASPGGEIRFTQRFDEQGRWVESGERSPDQGKTWYPFFEMTLSKQ